MTIKNKLPKLSVTLTDHDVENIDDIVLQHRPFVRRHAVHLAALRIGLSVLQAEPTRLIEQLDHDRNG